MDYKLLEEQDKIKHLQNRLGQLEQQHYVCVTNLELFKRLGETDSPLYTKEQEKLEEYERVHAQVKKLLEELESATASE